MKCFLVARFDATSDPPKLLGVSTYSESWNSLTLAHSSKYFYADLATGEGDSYKEAQESLMQMIDGYPGLRWARAWLDSSKSGAGTL
jgi:hypothetical protein